MDAFHSFWSVPNASKNNGIIDFPDFEILTAILSVLEWRKNNGRIKLITDSGGLAYFRDIGLDQLWNEIDTTLDDIDSSVDPFLFWAAGKLYALKSMQAPCVMLDTDLIIWKNVDYLKNRDLVTAHYEDLNPYVYPPRESFKLREGYDFPEDWDFTLKAANTAFLYIKDDKFKNYYVDSAIEFFKNINIEGLNPITAMCFAEQRVLPMCAGAKNQEMSYLLSLREADQQDIATHVWGFKQVLRDNPKARKEFCLKCVRRITEDFPDKTSLFQKREDLKAYYEEYLLSRGDR